jgi:hypothetical protein
VAHNAGFDIAFLNAELKACDVLSTLPNWDNLRLLDSELRGGHLLDRLHTLLAHYKGRGPLLLRQHMSLLTLQRSQ